MNQQITFVLWIQIQVLQTVLRRTMVDTKDLVHSLIGSWIRWDKQTDAILISPSPCIPKLANNEMLAYNSICYIRMNSLRKYWLWTLERVYTKNVKVCCCFFNQHNDKLIHFKALFQECNTFTLWRSTYLDS